MAHFTFTFKSFVGKRNTSIFNAFVDFYRGDVTEFGSLITTARGRQSSAFYPEFLQHFLLSSSFNFFIVQSEYLLAISIANY